MDARCISEGKEHKQYEFSNKVFITRTGTGVIIGALSFRNEFDGHTLDKAIEQVEKITGRAPRNGIRDRGYKVRDTVIPVPKPFSKAISTYQKNKERKYFRKRAGIELIIGHLKEDHRLSRNYYLANSINCQFVLPILKDKIPDDLNIDEFIILELNENNRLFKVD